MKVLRLMKLGKLGRVVDMLSDFFNISPKAGQTLKVGTVLMSIIHILSCLWWLWKVVAGGEDGAVDFLQRQSWDAGEVPAGLGSLAGKIQTYVMGCYLVTMTITTVGYGDISADNTAERVGYVVLFLFGAFVWGNLLAEVGEIHAASSAREAEKIQNVQAMLEFLMENDCPRVLRTRIVQYVRFAEEHHDNNVRKQVMIEKLPADLRTELLGHLFSPLMQRVPVFGFIRSSAGARTSDCFLAKVANMCQYRTLVPGEQLVDYADECDRLFIVVDGQLAVELEHPDMDIDPQYLQAGDYIGDYGILGERDWGASTTFNLRVNRTGEPIEIRVSAHHTSHTVLLELLEEAFQDALSHAAFDVQQCVGMFCSMWQAEKLDAAALDGYSRKHLLRWDILTRKMLKRDRRTTTPRQATTPASSSRPAGQEAAASVQQWHFSSSFAKSQQALGAQGISGTRSQALGAAHDTMVRDQVDPQPNRYTPVTRPSPAGGWTRRRRRKARL